MDVYHFSKKHLFRSISICDYILEDSGHTVFEAAKEFRVSPETIRRSIQIVGIASTSKSGAHEISLSSEELMEKYKAVKGMLAILALKNHKKQ